MIKGINHIAIAVPDLELAIRRFAEDFGLSVADVEDVPIVRTRTAFFPVENTQVELVSPLDGEGAIAKFLETRRGGLHHICFRTDDIHGDVERLKEKGYEFTTESPHTGAHGSLVIFIHPRTCDGLLVELCQPKS